MASPGGFSGALRSIVLFSVTVLSMRLLTFGLKKSTFLYKEGFFFVLYYKFLSFCTIKFLSQGEK